MANKIPLLDRDLIRGDYEEIDFEVKDPDGSARDISTDTFVFTAKKDITKTTIYLSKSSTEEDEIIKTDAANGLGKVVIQPEDFALLQEDTTFICDVRGIVITDDQKPYTSLFKVKVKLNVSPIT